MIKSVKRLGAAVLSAVMMLTAVATPLGDNLPAVRESTSLTAGADSYWVGSSKYGYYANNSTALNEVKAIMSKNCSSSEIARFNKILSEFPLSGYFNSYKTKACSLHCSQCEKRKELLKKGCRYNFYDDETGKTIPCSMADWNNAIQCAGYAIYCYYRFMGKMTCDIITLPKGFTADQLKNVFSDKNIRTGAHFRKLPGHSLCYLTRDDNYIYFIDANAGYNSATGCGSKDKNNHYQTCCKINLHKYTYKEFASACSSGKLTIYNSGTSKFDNGSTPSTDNVKLTGTSYKIANTVSDTNAFVVTDVYKPSNYKLTKAGIRIRRYDGSYDNGWSEFHNTASTWTGYDYMRISYDMNSEVKITLRHGTKYYYKFYAVIEGKEYWSPEQSFTTTGSHSYGSWYTKTSATCTSGGTEERKCSCGATESRSTSALGHSYGYWETDRAATCTDGGTEVRICSRCSNAEYRSTSATGHSYGYWETDREATCTEEGTEVRICSKCNDAEYRTVSALGHNYSSEWTIDKPATCSAEGSKSRHCTRCDAKTEVTAIAKIAHTYTSKVVKPTFTEQGYTLYTCTKCGYSYKSDYIAKLTKPNPVSGLTYYNRSADTISVKWGKVSNADGYILEWLNGNKFEKAASFTANDDLKYTFENLSPATMYKFRVRCYKVSGGTRYYSDYSTVLNVKTYPQKISEVKQTAATESSVTVWWDKTESARGYVIEKLNGDTWERVITLKDGLLNTYTVTGLNPSTEYQFRIKRYITDGEKMLFGAYSEVCTATTSPKTPVNFAVSAKSSTYFTFKWDKDEKADGYEIQQYTNGKWTAVAKTYGNTYTVKNLKAGTAGYKFRLRAYIEGKDLDAYSNCSSVLTLNTNPYGVGGFKTKTVTSTNVTLQWNKGTTAEGYQLQQYKDGKWVTIFTADKAETTSYTVKGLKAGTAGYRFRIRAYKTFGSTKQYGSWSNELVVNTNPYGVGGFKTKTVTSTNVTLQWNKGTTAEGYQLQQYKSGSWVTVFTADKAETTSYTVKGLNAGTAGYKFRIRAYKTYGSTKQYGSWSNELIVNTNPYGVGGFKTKTVTSTNVTLQWNKGTTAEGYQLQQYKSGSWVTIFTADKAATTTYTVKSLKADTSYKFRIRAYKTYGSTKQYGSWSSELTVRTKK